MIIPVWVTRVTRKANCGTWNREMQSLFACFSYLLRDTLRTRFKLKIVSQTSSLRVDVEACSVVVKGLVQCLPWQIRAWFKLFRRNRLVNEEGARTYEEWRRQGARRIAGVGLCPILFHLPWGLLAVMLRAASVPSDRVKKSQDPLSNGAVSFEEMNAAAFLMGRNSDTVKADTFGMVKGELMVVD